ncbi:response regulator [Allosphingosinicella sp.]|jgi:CheY-like chemotaxis protein|uniref:response regulator n=1 Tax=Allosphingosinicella sp. TaxID=2823234 RepID=UPI002F102419
MTALAGLRILLVEDEAIIAMTAEDMLGSLGCEVVLTAGTLAEAIEAAKRGGFQAAMLDINLNGSASLPVADILKQAGTPFIFTTGYDSSGASPHRDVPLVTKPYQIADLAAALALAIERGG